MWREINIETLIILIILIVLVANGYLTIFVGGILFFFGVLILRGFRGERHGDCRVEKCCRLEKFDEAEFQKEYHDHPPTINEQDRLGENMLIAQNLTTKDYIFTQRESFIDPVPFGEREDRADRRKDIYDMVDYYSGVIPTDTDMAFVIENNRRGKLADRGLQSRVKASERTWQDIYEPELQRFSNMNVRW